MAEVTGVTGRVSQQEELQKKQAAEAAKKRLNTEKLAATEKPAQATSVNPFNGDTTEVAALNEKERIKKAQEEIKARFEANPSENPANMAGQSQVAELNKMKIDYKFYRLKPEDATGVA